MLCGVDLVVAVEGLEPGGVVVAAASDASRRAAIAAAARGGGRVLVVSSVGFARLPPGKFSVVDGGDEWPADASNVAARAVDVRRALLSRGEACGAARRVVGGAATVIFDGVGVTAGDCLGLVAPRGPNRRLVVLLGRTDSRMSTVAAFLRLGGAAVAEWREPTAAHVEIYLGRNSVTKYDGSIDAAAWVRMFAAQQEVIQGSSTDVSKGKDAGECAAVRAAVAAMRARRGDDVLVVYTASRLDCERRAVSFLTTADNDDEMQPLDSARLKALAATVADDAALAGMLRRGVGIWHCGLLPAAREAVELAALAGLVRIIFATLDYPHQTARCVVATPKLLGEGGAVSSFDDYVHRLVEGAGRVEVCQLVEAFRECECDDALEVHDADESYGLALALRAALAGAPPAAVCEASLAHYEAAKRSGDGALRRNEARTCRLALRQIAARHGAAWLQPGRVARCGDGRWGVVLASVQGSAADVLVDDKRGARIERLHSNSLRLTCIRVFVGSGDLHRVEQRDGLVRSLRGALADCGGAKSKESKGGKKDDKKSKKKRKRLEAKHPRLEAKHARVEYIDDSGVIEARGADVRLAARVRTRLDALRGDSEDDDSDGEPESASARPGLASLVAEAQLARGDASNRTKRATQALLRLGLVAKHDAGLAATPLGSATAEVVFALPDERRALVACRVLKHVRGLGDAKHIAGALTCFAALKASPCCASAAAEAAVAAAVQRHGPLDKGAVAFFGHVHDAAFDVADACGDGAAVAYDFASSFSSAFCGAALNSLSNGPDDVSHPQIFEGDVDAALRASAAVATHLAHLAPDPDLAEMLQNAAKLVHDRLKPSPQLKFVTTSVT